MTKTQFAIVAILTVAASYFIFFEGKEFMKFVQPLDEFSPAPRDPVTPGSNTTEYT